MLITNGGNSAAVKLALKAFNAQMMSIWYLTNASAQVLMAF